MSIWVHVTGHTFGSWLPGDDRTFRTRHHREHITSDTKRYADRRTRAQEAMRSAGRNPVMLSVEARRVGLEAMVESLTFRGCTVRIACLDSHHFHILLRLPSNPPPTKPTLVKGWVPDPDPRGSHPWASSEGASRNDDCLLEVRTLLGHAKSRAARSLSTKGLVAPGGVWATRMHMTRILDLEHGAEVVAYIREHTMGERDGVLWEHGAKAT